MVTPQAVRALDSSEALLSECMWKVLDLVLDVHDSQGNARPLRSVWVSFAQNFMVLHACESSQHLCSLPLVVVATLRVYGSWSTSWDLQQVVCSLYGSRSPAH